MANRAFGAVQVRCRPAVPGGAFRVNPAPRTAQAANDNTAEKLLRFEPLPVGIEEAGDEHERQDEEQQVGEGVKVTHK
jgi:hypothetical protein